MAYVLSSVSGNLISAASAGYAPTNSGDVSAIASAYQVVSATATQLYAGTAYVTSINDAPISAARAGNAANASMATSAYYDGTGRLISALPDSAAVSAIASSYAESAVSGKQDALTFGYDTANSISSIDGSALAGGGGGLITSIQTAQDPWWWQTAISGLNGSSIYSTWAEFAKTAEYANSATSASYASSAVAAPTGWASSFISSVSSPSGTIRVLNGNEIEGTNSALLPSTVVEGFSVVSSLSHSTAAFSFTVPTSNPNTQVIITGGWANGNFGISGDNGVTAESSVAGPLNVTFDMPGATAFDVTSEAWVSDIGYTASALASEVGGGVGELAWASALPTYQYNANDQISSINGSALGGMDEAAVSGIASSYAESAVSSKADASALSGYYTTANESGFITGVDLTDYATTAYVDSAVSSKADSSALSSYALSADVSGTVDLVSTQSANWGGSALALSAGPGVKLEKVGDTLVASTDETLLWSGSEWVSAAPTISLSGSVSSYDRIGIYAGGYGDTTQQDFKMVHFSAEDTGNGVPLNIQGIAGDYTVVRFNVGLVFPSANGSALRFVGFRQYNVGNSVATAQTPAKVRKIVGINRTAEA